MNLPAKVRITARVWSHLEGTGAGQAVIGVRRSDGTTREEAVATSGSEADVRVIEKILDARTLKDGSCTILVETADEVFGLDLWASNMEDGAADNVGPYDSWALGDLNAARALRRALAKLQEVES